MEARIKGVFPIYFNLVGGETPKSAIFGHFWGRSSDPAD